MRHATKAASLIAAMVVVLPGHPVGPTAHLAPPAAVLRPSGASVEAPHSVAVARLPAAALHIGARSEVPNGVADPVAYAAAKTADGQPGGRRPLLASLKTSSPAPTPLMTAERMPALLASAQDIQTSLPIAGRNEVAAGGYYPPDVQVAVGPTSVVEFVNSAGAIWTKTGQFVRSFSLDAFFSTGSDRLSDPRILYDGLSGRWFASAMDMTTEDIDVAVSSSSDPAGSWVTYAFPSNLPTSTCPDQPKLGLADQAVVLTANAFQSSACQSDPGAASVGAKVWVLNKAQMLAGASVDSQIFGPDPRYFGIAPAQSLTSSSTVYLVSVDNLVSSTLHLFTVTGAPSPGMTIPVSNIAIYPLRTPPQAAQAGTGTRLDTGDIRVQDATYRNGTVSLAANDACVPPGDTVSRSCARVVNVSTSTDTVLNAGEVSFTGEDAFYPAFRPDTAGNLDVVFGYSAAATYPSLAVAVFRADGTWSSSTLTVAAGTAPVLDVAPGASYSRFGDYFGAAVDPSDPSTVWVAGEIGAAGGPTGTWGTSIVAMSYGSAPAPPTPTPSPTPTPTPSLAPSPTPSPSPTPPPAAAAPTIFTVTQGQAATIAQSGPASTAFELQSSPDGTTWTTLTNLSTDVSGNATYTFTPTATAYYRSVFPGAQPSSPVLGVVLPPLSAALTVTASSNVITWATGVTLSVDVAPSGASGAGRAVELIASRDSITWSTIASLTTDTTGSASFSYRPATNLWYRAVVPGAPDLPAGTSAPARVVVRQIALLRPTNSGSVRQVSRGTTLTFTTTVRPARPELAAAMVTLVVYHYVAGHWVLIAQRDRSVDADGRASWSWRFSSPGAWYVRSIANPTPYNANSVWSPVERYNVG